MSRYWENWEGLGGAISLLGMLLAMFAIQHHWGWLLAAGFLVLTGIGIVCWAVRAKKKTLEQLQKRIAANGHAHKN